MRVNGPNRALAIEASKIPKIVPSNSWKHDFNARDKAGRDLVFKPFVQCLDLIHREWRIDMIDTDIRR